MSAAIVRSKLWQLCFLLASLAFFFGGSLANFYRAGGNSQCTPKEHCESVLVVSVIREIGGP